MSGAMAGDTHGGKTAAWGSGTNTVNPGMERHPAEALLPRSAPPTTPRSPTRLYPLEPIGVDTPLVESLISYLARLAAEHCVAPMGLIAQEIAPHVGKRFARDPRACQQFFSDRRHLLALCGSGPVARDWTQALERLTGWSDLTPLTLAAFDRVITAPTRATLRPGGRWCPDCYEAWRGVGSELYGPLIWMMDAVSWCPIHQTPLAAVCPNAACGHTATWRISQAQRGRCPHCGCWLGRSAHVAQAVEPAQPPVGAGGASLGRHADADRAWQARVAESVGVLLAVADRRDATAAAPVVQQALARWGSALPMSVGALLQRRAGVTERMLRDWGEGSSRPSLPQVLRLCRVLELSAADLLWSDAPAIQSQLAQVAQRFERLPGASHGSAGGTLAPTGPPALLPDAQAGTS